MRVTNSVLPWKIDNLSLSVELARLKVYSEIYTSCNEIADTLL